MRCSLKDLPKAGIAGVGIMPRLFPGTSRRFTVVAPPKQRSHQVKSRERLLMTVARREQKRRTDKTKGHKVPLRELPMRPMNENGP